MDHTATQSLATSKIPGSSVDRGEQLLETISREPRRSRRTRTMSSEPDGHAPSISRTGIRRASTTPNVSRPTSSRHSSRRNSSTPQTSIRALSSCSRPSSFLISQPSEIHFKRPPVLLRSSSAIHARKHSYTSFTSCTEYTPLFPSLEASLASGADLSSVGLRAQLTLTNLPSVYPSSVAESSLDQSLPTITHTPSFKHQPRYSNHIPATTIDWTDPSTRRKQYYEIDRSCRGIRGMVRRLIPSRFGSSAGRIVFYDAEKSSDADTVRRYRMDDDQYDSGLDEIKGEKHCFGKDVVRTGRSGSRQLKKWLCFRFWGMKQEQNYDAAADE